MNDLGFLNKREAYVKKTLKEAVDETFKLLTILEGIIPALESSHAIAYAIRIAKKFKKDHAIIVNISGRENIDIETIYG
ncbi:MAG: hypothetical protein IKG14_00660 [Clostridia bacterium]|nr:hypothetical protein [Clostridia bacterium]